MPPRVCVQWGIGSNYLNCVVHEVNSIRIEIMLVTVIVLDFGIIDSFSLIFSDDNHLSVICLGSVKFETRVL